MDTSDHIIEGVLLQENQKEKQRPLRYMFKMINSIEQNYTISKKEMLTII